jgi:hypothetical protein
LSGGAVRDSFAGAKGQKHVAKKQVFHRKRLIKVEKSSFYLTFFCFGKKVRKELFVFTFFLALP